MGTARLVCAIATDTPRIIPYLPEVSKGKKMKTIPLTQGYYALVSDKDYRRVVEAGPWRARVERRKDGSVWNVYAQTGPPGKELQMHRFILNLTSSVIKVDHSPDSSGLNNQHSNLRVATHAENMHNQRISKGNTSGYKGVSREKKTQKWRAVIYLNCKQVYLGLFSTKRAAKKAYDIAAVKYFGRFSCTNKSMGLL
jgi:hypothetical protein